jgi:hypothetical protein
LKGPNVPGLLIGRRAAAGTCDTNGSPNHQEREDARSNPSPRSAAIRLAEECRVTRYAVMGLCRDNELGGSDEGSIDVRMARLVDQAEILVCCISDDASHRKDDITLTGDCEPGIRVRQ